MSKHSPAPWKWENQNGCYLIASDGTKILLAEGVDGSPEDDDLIAAAPELLTWVKWASKYLTEEAKNSGQYDMLMAVIKKAEGNK